MIKVELGNVFSTVLSFDEYAEEKAFKKALTFTVPGFMFMTSYKKGVWDGTYSFYNNYTQKFLTGLLQILPPRLKERLDTEDMRVRPLCGIQPTCKLIGVTLRDYQEEAVTEALLKERCIITAPTNAGKSQPLDATVWTPSGPVKMGDVKRGTKVLTPKGGIAEVIRVFPQGKLDVFRITFRNGDTVECSADHLWKMGSRINWTEEKVVPLSEILRHYKQKSGRPIYQIYPTHSVHFAPRIVRIHPYFLGVLLGDGYLGERKVGLSTTDKEIITEMSNLLEGYEWKSGGRCDYYLAKTKRGGRNQYFEDLRHYGLMGKRAETKFIPEDFKYNSSHIRLAVLQGLMDTDGSPQKGPRGVEFYTVSKRLALDVKEVAESLGAVCRLRSRVPKFTYKGKRKSGQRAYTVTIGGPLAHELFTLPRKKRLIKVGSKHQSRVIVKIEKVGKKECQCILLDDPYHLYLTDHFIPTHNTELAAGIMSRMPCATLWLTHRENLLYQTKERLESRLGEPVGIIHRNALSPGRVTVAMVPTLHRRLTSRRKPVKEQIKAILGEFDMLFLDECHHTSSTTWRLVAKNCNAFYRFGLSATPLLREQIENIWLIGVTGGEIETVTNKELIERGISARPNIFILRNYISVTGAYQYVYQKGVEENLARNMSIGYFAREHAKKKEPCLTLVNTICHGDCVMKRMPAGTVFLTGKDDVNVRINALKQLADGNIPGIVATPIFDEGVDAPAIKVLILAAAGKSQIRLLQRLGRGMRQKTDGDNKLTVYDFEDKGNRFLEHHGAERRKVYSEEGFDVSYISVKEKKKDENFLSTN